MEMQPSEHERRPSPRTITPLSTPAALGGMGLLRFPYHQDELRNLVRSALDEDEAFNDLTTIATVVSDRHARGQLVARAEGVLCGVAGAVGAVFLLILGKEIALPSLLHTGPLNAGNDVQALGFTLNALILVGTGLLLGAAGSGLTIRRFLQV